MVNKKTKRKRRYTNKKNKRINTKKRNTKKYIKVNCSPKDKNEINDFTCYTNDTLYKLKELWNIRHPDAVITNKKPINIHKKLSEYLGDVCNKESCWLNQSSLFGNNNSNILLNIKDKTFSPNFPESWLKNPNEWLSSLDIIKVMKQYENTYKCFDFIGPSPIDFDTKLLYGNCVWDELCNFSLNQQIKNGKTKIGIIFNTDPHTKGGQHWISLFINIKKKYIFYFDSVGTKPPKEINDFITKVYKQGLQLNPKIIFKIDSTLNIEHQKGNSECGVYSLYFIINMLEDTTNPSKLKNKFLTDKYINKFRNIYFNNNI